jgi:DNA-binding IclR family transcriptional regulator
MLAAHQAVDGEVPLSQDELEATLQQVRALGRWQGDSLQASGVVDISIPVLGPYGQALAVLTCPFIRCIDRHIGPDLDTTCALLQRAARGLSIA